MSLIKSESSNSILSLECMRQNHTQDLCDKLPNDIDKDLLDTDLQTLKSVTCMSGSVKEDPEEEYVRNHLKNYSWYHGMMFGQIVDKLLKWDYSFLVRRAMVSTSHRLLCISVRIDSKLFHYQLMLNDKGWACPKLYDKFPKMPKKRYQHIYNLIDAWSAVATFIVPISRKSMVLQHKCIQLQEVLGKGAFGEVHRGTYTPYQASIAIEVAVKLVKGTCRRSALMEFCHEASIMAVLQHENVVSFYGIASLEEPIMVVMEMVNGGDLKKYIQKTPNLPKIQILFFALNIANGMRHLAFKNVIHRDVAARNCLVTKGRIAKISDFGLSVQATEVIVKNLKKAPIRWLAPETFAKGVFNEKTDVWSYGVLLTELMTKCKNDPLAPRNLKEAQKWVKESEHPHHIENSEIPELLSLVDICCDKNPKTRVNFSTVKRRMSAIYHQCLMEASPNNGEANIEKESLCLRKSDEKLKTHCITLKRRKSSERTVKFSTMKRRQRKSRSKSLAHAPSCDTNFTSLSSSPAMPSSSSAPTVSLASAPTKSVEPTVNVAKSVRKSAQHCPKPQPPQADEALSTKTARMSSLLAMPGPPPPAAPATQPAPPPPKTSARPHAPPPPADSATPQTPLPPMDATTPPRTSARPHAPPPPASSATLQTPLPPMAATTPPKTSARPHAPPPPKTSARPHAPPPPKTSARPHAPPPPASSATLQAPPSPVAATTPPKTSARPHAPPRKTEDVDTAKSISQETPLSPTASIKAMPPVPAESATPATTKSNVPTEQVTTPSATE